MAPISNDLLLAAALSTGMTAAVAQTAPTAGSRTGVATTVKAGAARSSTTKYIDGATDQRLTTDANSTMHVLFSDQSAVTLGPNSELTIAKYEFNPQKKEGQILLDLTKGLLRVVGGLISKKTETVVRTSTATIGIRGGISLVSNQNNQTSAHYLFGQSMRVTDNGGTTQTLTRQGFGVNLGSSGSLVLQRTPGGEFSRLLNQLDSGGSSNRDGTGNTPTGSTQADGLATVQLLSTGGGTGGSDPVGGLSNDRLGSSSDSSIDTTRDSMSGLAVDNTGSRLRAILANSGSQNTS